MRILSFICGDPPCGNETHATPRDALDAPDAPDGTPSAAEG
jgi:hypothetical protein